MYPIYDSYGYTVAVFETLEQAIQAIKAETSERFYLTGGC